MNGRVRRVAVYELEAAAQLTRLPPARVRRYVRVGLVRPARVEGRTAFFTDAELARLRTIRRLGDDLGLNTAGVEVVLRLVDEITTLRQALDERPDRR
jgi:MerR family transcriptional regulator/heat shock protein HspR